MTIKLSRNEIDTGIEQPTHCLLKEKVIIAASIMRLCVDNNPSELNNAQITTASRNHYFIKNRASRSRVEADRPR